MKYTSDKQENLLWNKVLFTLGTILLYFIGRSLPLYQVDVAAYADKVISAEAVLLQVIRGDRYQYSLLALGISPYMISNILTMMCNAFKSSEARARVSQRKMNRRTMKMTLIFSVLMAVMQAPKLQFKMVGDMFPFVIVVACVEMIAGSMFIIWLAGRNKKYGIGGQSALIFVNLLDSFYNTLRGHAGRELVITLVLTAISIVAMAIMENKEKRIPLQRVSIHNIYADKNYLAIKMNPIGVMPAMFSMAMFMLIQLVVSLFGLFFAEHPYYLWIVEQMVLTKPLGISVYVVCVYVLSIVFSRALLNPQETTEQFLKSGDSIQNIHAGKETKKYLSGVITGLALLSATVMACCLSVPLVLQMRGELQGALATLPSSAMMLVGVVCNMWREVVAIHHLEGYKPFI
ncbi:MAG: preprotein translocase subunit SecY [Lachnospiraceae bacterium]|nr:preprotein translocase subunit SecY [Lachnospiraceae bacterium]